MSVFFLGIDVGSTTLKAVLLDEDGKVCNVLYKRSQPMEAGKVKCIGKCSDCGKCYLGSVKKDIKDFLSGIGISSSDIKITGITGSQVVEDMKKFVNFDLKVSEISAHVAGARYSFPDCEAIIDVGGQDSKAMLYNPEMRMWTSKMSGICAAGTGAFLDTIAGKLGVPVEDMSEKVDYDSDLEFSSICTVLSATSVNKFKNRYPIGQIIAGACKAQARTIVSGVGELLYGYKGENIIFQGGVASNNVVVHYLREITGKNIIIPKLHSVMGALGTALLAKQYNELNCQEITDENKFKFSDKREALKSVSMRAVLTRKDFFNKNSQSEKPLVWRNLFYPAEILNALNVRIFTLETYAAFFSRDQHKMKSCLDLASCKGFSAETCTFLRVLEGLDLPRPDFAVSTSEPCQQGERIIQDLCDSHNSGFYSLSCPNELNEYSVETLAQDIEKSVFALEKALDIKMNAQRLQEACEFSNIARDFAQKSNEIRMSSPPLIRGSSGIYFANVFSQMWGRRDFIELQKKFFEELSEKRDNLNFDSVSLQDTHRLLWLHLPPFYNTRLLDHIELTCNAPIIFEEVNYVGWEPLDVRDPYRSLAKKLLSIGFLDPKLRARKIKEAFLGGKLNGCILYNHGFGRCSMSDSSFIKRLRKELIEIGVPLLILDGDCMDASTDPCSTYTKISSYIESLNENKYGNIFGFALKQKAALLN